MNLPSPPPKNEEKLVIYLPSDLKAKVKGVADKQGIKMSHLIRDLVEQTWGKK